MMKFIRSYSPAVLLLVFLFTLSVLFFALPKQDYSENEKRVLAEPPLFSLESLIDGQFMTETESYLSDHFPFRDAFVGLQSYYELVTGRGGAADIYYGKDGYLIAAQSDSASDETVRTNTQNYAAFAAHLGLEASLLPVPQAGYSLADKLPAVHRPFEDDLFFEAVDASKGAMTLIDVREDLQAGADRTPLYFKTDHHLNMNGAFALYNAYLRSRSMTPLTDYASETYDGFYGTGYSKSGYWGAEPDAIELFKSELADEVTVTLGNGVGEPAVHDSLFFYDHLENMDKYPLYLDGNHGLVTITNPEAPEGKLLIVKDSFAHSAVTLLCQHYREIYMVDLRYYSDSADLTVAELVKQHGLQEALFLYGVDSLATDSSSSFKLFYGIEEALP